jgi:hypothetical protein
MAYIAPTDPTKKPGEQFLASGGAPGAVASGSAPSSPPASDGGQRFGAMRSFFAANQPAADAQIGAVTQPIAQRGQEAVDLAAKSGGLTASGGGPEAAGKALDAKQEALGMLRDTESVGGMAGLIGEGKGADYTEGQRNADAYLYGRAPGMEEFRSRWGGVLGALSPGYKPDPVTPPPYSGPPPRNTKPRTNEDAADYDVGKDRRTEGRRYREAY